MGKKSNCMLAGLCCGNCAKRIQSRAVVVPGVCGAAVDRTSRIRWGSV